jgi:hypothetical protein
MYEKQWKQLLVKYGVTFFVGYLSISGTGVVCCHYTPYLLLHYEALIYPFACVCRSLN